MRPLVFLAALTWGLAAPAAAQWPSIPFPDQARVESLGDQVRVNGVPMRMYRVLMPQGARDLAAYYREQLGPRVAETRVLGDRLLSQGRGHHFITVRVHPLAKDRSVALVSVSDAQAASQPSPGKGIPMPAGSAVLSDMESVDAGRGSRHLVVQNRLGVAANLKALEQELARRGLQPEARDYRADAGNTVRFYRGDRREARLVLTRKDDITFIELTTLQDL